MPDDWGKLRKDKSSRVTTFECDTQSVEKLQAVLRDEKNAETEVCTDWNHPCGGSEIHPWGESQKM